MQGSKDVILSYHKAMQSGNYSGARQLLHDNLEFQGPIETFHKADDYIHALQKLSAIVDHIDILKVFEDGNDVCLLCDLVTKTLGTSFVVEWYKVKEGKIASVRAVFDARPFAAMFAKGSS